MNKRIFSIGLVIIIIGLFLAIAFWPLTGISGEQLSKKRTDQGYKGYGKGDKVKVYGTITDLEGTDLPSWAEDLGLEDTVLVELDGNFTFIVKGSSQIQYSEGDSVYVNLALKEGVLTSYWQANSKDDIKSKTTIDYIFYGLVGFGIAVAAVGADRE